MSVLPDLGGQRAKEQKTENLLCRYKSNSIPLVKQSLMRFSMLGSSVVQTILFGTTINSLYHSGHQHYGTMEGGAKNNTASTSINTTINTTTMGEGNRTSNSKNTSDDITRQENQILKVIFIKLGILSLTLLWLGLW